MDLNYNISDKSSNLEIFKVQEIQRYKTLQKQI